MNKINLAIKILHGLSITITTTFAVYFFYIESKNNALDNLQDTLGLLLALTSFYWHATIGLSVAVYFVTMCANGAALALLPPIALLCWSIKKRRVKHEKASL